MLNEMPTAETGQPSAFARFAEQLYRQCPALGFKWSGREAARPLSETEAFSLYKIDNGQLYLFHVVDIGKHDETTLRYRRDHVMAQTKQMTENYKNIVSLFLWVGCGTPTDPLNTPFIHEAEQFFGQSPYSVYWYVNLDTKTVAVPNGQPDDLVGLHKGVLTALGNLMPSHAGLPPGYRPEDPPAPPAHLRSRNALLTILLAVANLGVMLFALVRFSGAEYCCPYYVELAKRGGIIPEAIRVYGRVYRLFTATFIHFGWEHLILNIVGMLLFGIRVERYYGKIPFLLIYLLSGLLASVFSLFLTLSGPVDVSAGASGSVFGLLGATLAYTLVTKREMDNLGYSTVIAFIVINFLFGAFQMNNIDQWAHVGGLLGGFLVGLVSLMLISKAQKDEQNAK